MKRGRAAFDEIISLKGKAPGAGKWKVIGNRLYRYPCDMELNHFRRPLVRMEFCNRGEMLCSAH
jgi:hypothetical protein